MQGELVLSSNQKRTRLWLTSPHFYPSYGGAQNRYRSYIPGFLDRGMEVRVMTGTPQISERGEVDSESDWYQAPPGSWLPQIILEGVPLEQIRLPDYAGSLRTKIYYDALLEVCQRTTSGPVVAQLMTNMRPEALPWLRRLKNSGVATVYSVSQFPTWHKKRLTKRVIERRGLRRVYNEFDALVTNSELILEFLRDMGVKTRMEYIPNGVNLQRFHPTQSAQDQQDREALRSRFNIPENDLVIVVVGAVMPRKGPDNVIRAWRQILPQFPHTHLLFVGPRTDTYNPKFEEFGNEIADLVATSGAPKQVHFTGFVNDVDRYLRAADIFILASKREGTPNSVLEAMSVCLPCIVTNYIGISKGIGRAGDHYQLVDCHPDAITTALGSLLQSPELRGAFGSRGQRFVVENVDQRQSINRYVELYEELAADTASRR